MVQRLPSGQRNAFDASEPPRIDQFRKALRPLIGIIYKDMGVSFPPININILLYRFLREMTLPIEIYPSVKVLAEMCNYDFAFHFPRSVGQKAITVFPEAQLIALVTVAVKLLLPFDPDASRFSPHTLSEPAAQRIDWTTWLKIQRSKTSPSDRESSGAFNGGNESSSLRSLLTTTSTDVFDLTPKDLDRYMDWYQQTWANSDLLNQNPANKEILKLFPLEPIQPRSTVPQEQQISKDQAVEDALNEKLKAVHQTLLSRTPIPDTLHAQNTEDASNPSSSLSVIRPGENYVTTKPWLFDETLITSENPLGETSASNLTEPERQFWLRASEISGFSIKQLLRAVRETENKISKWLNSKRRTEYWEDIDSRKRTDETVERQQSSMNEGDAHADADHVAIADDAMVVDEDVDSADGDM
ncbi:putative rna polymerase i specific transcription initiation factor [Phaeomoniella chlamydospora]|uniref:Putative rna polymerase i specific transcription initiation factor n=1 Tax=Phaeomoniella chlamydospora TaxID=158046 RepID=A0A0G2GVX5_PHACM|nr:putative rna polymerase i specific transcription initiation factor [Phaeomoniella chlamydospora]